jgi:polyisoprenoid-binding protein YceI
MKKVMIPLLMMFFVTALSAQTTWKLDHSHSNVRFTVKHLVISEVEGSFKIYDGTLKSDKNDFTDADINFSVDVSSINTNNEKRDNHLRSDDFFNAERFPEMVFKSNSFRKISDGKYELTGDLTIRDITKPVKFDVTYGGMAEDGYGNIKSAFKAVTTINRFDYDLKWNAMTELGGAVVGKDVTIDLRLQFGKPKDVVGSK